MALPFNRLLNLVWHWASRNADEEQRHQLEDALDSVVPIGDPYRPAPNAGEHHPGLANPAIRAPKWWRGDRAAFRSSTRAMEQVGSRPRQSPRGARPRGRAGVR